MNYFKIPLIIIKLQYIDKKGLHSLVGKIRSPKVGALQRWVTHTSWLDLPPHHPLRERVYILNITIHLASSESTIVSLLAPYHFRLPPLHLVRTWFPNETHL